MQPSVRCRDRPAGLGLAGPGLSDGLSGQAGRAARGNRDAGTRDVARRAQRKGGQNSLAVIQIRSICLFVCAMDCSGTLTSIGVCGMLACGVQEALNQQTSKVEQLSKAKEELTVSEAKSRKLAEQLESKVGELLHQKMEDASTARMLKSELAAAAKEEACSDQRAQCQNCRVSNRAFAS